MDVKAMVKVMPTTTVQMMRRAQDPLTLPGTNVMKTTMRAMVLFKTLLKKA
jgi:CO dehydrogenase/acetyl-CoA synthase epsilon subunit